MLNREVFGKGMAILTALYPDYPLKDETIEGYWEFLQHMSNQAFELAIKSHISKNKWFPKVSELIEAAQPPEPHPGEIWSGLVLAAERGQKPDLDYPTQRAIDGACGGWEKFISTPYDELKFTFKNFKEVYLHARESQKASQGLLGGAPLPQIGEVDGQK